MRALDETEVLDLWDRGQRAGPVERALLLLGAARPEASREGLLDTPLDERDAAILALRETTYGRALPGWTRCPACSEKLTFELDARTDAAAIAPPLPERIGARAPTSRDLAAISGSIDPLDATQRLMDRIGATGDAGPGDPDDASLAFSCAACGAGWTETFDVAAYLWEEIDQHARRLIDDVDALAFAYGWSERDILAMAPPRRAAYLERRL